VVSTNSKDRRSARPRGDRRQLESAGYDVLLDDRDERPESSSKTPTWSVSLSYQCRKKVTEGTVEVVRRSTLLKEDVKISDITQYFQNLRPAAR